MTSHPREIKNTSTKVKVVLWPYIGYVSCYVWLFDVVFVGDHLQGWLEIPAIFLHVLNGL